MQKGFSVLMLAFLVAILALLGGGGYYFLHQQKIASINSFAECSQYFTAVDNGDELNCDTPRQRFSKPDLEEVPTLPEASISASERNPGWVMFSGHTAYGGEKKFSIEYPGEWYREGRVLYPDGKDAEFRVWLGSGGRGMAEHITSRMVKKSFNGIEARYYWDKSLGYASFSIENIAYIFEFVDIPEGENAYYEKIFIKMLNTFKKI